MEDIAMGLLFTVTFLFGVVIGTALIQLSIKQELEEMSNKLNSIYKILKNNNKKINNYESGS